MKRKAVNVGVNDLKTSLLHQLKTGILCYWLHYTASHLTFRSMLDLLNNNNGLVKRSWCTELYSGRKYSAARCYLSVVL